jgi:hypothetical protein
VGARRLCRRLVAEPVDDDPGAKTEMPQVKSDASNPASSCKSQRSGSNFAASHNGQTFTQFYGTSGSKGHHAGANAFGKCVSAIAMHKPDSHGKDSAETGDKESAKGESPGEDSAETGDKESAKGESPGEDSAKSHAKGRANPAMSCKAMQAQDPAHFQTVYGTRPNALGKCVANETSSKKG